MKEKISVSEMNYKEKLKYKTIIKLINGNIIYIFLAYSLLMV